MSTKKYIPGDNGAHEVHLGELPRFQRNIWAAKVHTLDDFGDEVMVKALFDQPARFFHCFFDAIRIRVQLHPSSLHIVAE